MLSLHYFCSSLFVLLLPFSNTIDITKIATSWYIQRMKQKNNPLLKGIEPCIFCFPGSRTTTLLGYVFPESFIFERKHFRYSSCSLFAQKGCLFYLSNAWWLKHALVNTTISRKFLTLSYSCVLSAGCIFSSVKYLSISGDFRCFTMSDASNRIQ